MFDHYGNSLLTAFPERPKKHSSNSPMVKGWGPLGYKSPELLYINYTRHGLFSRMKPSYLVSLLLRKLSNSCLGRELFSLLTQAFPKWSTLFHAQAACSKSTSFQGGVAPASPGKLPCQQHCWCDLIFCSGLSGHGVRSALAGEVLASAKPPPTSAILPLKEVRSWKEFVLVSFLYTSAFYRDNFWACELTSEQRLLFVEPIDMNADDSLNSTSPFCHSQLRKCV